ncbi:tyrosine-type recombinase/integrase [Paenibacillus cremeus]|uniref:Tyrosine-type recombinase/integrase n=1 Tax=Paenibacillus cremeus TaxID=2163881 RepID=A0A559KCW5_9BACL|nr:tyrosine-type recombinase/integrase [Paenibacillus cremeus]TVY09939.1 tyrosine-type recombinase/integrase [Paenibacillus cremeus]
MQSLKNIVGFVNSSVYSDICLFLEDVRLSEGTKIGYKHDIELFFSFLGKNLLSLSFDDLQIEHKTVVHYRNFLINDKKYSSSSVNRKIASLQSLYAFFKRNKYDTKYGIDTEVFQIDKLNNKSKSYGDLSPEEVDAMIVAVQKQVKGLEKSLLIRMATRTSYREDTLLNLSWDDLQVDHEQNCCFVNTVEEKTDKEMSQPITLDLYNDLKQIKSLTYYQRYSDNKIFHLSKRTIWEMMNTLKEELGIHPKRNIVFHSFRNFAPNFIIDTQGDFKAAQMQTGHSDINTLWKSYVNKKRDVSKMAGILLDEEIDNDAFDELTFDEMKMLLNGTRNGMRTQLLREAMKIIGNR